MSQLNLENLAAQLKLAREKEAQAKEVRVALEEEFCRAAMMPETFKGTRSFDLGAFKVKIIRPLTTTVDADQLKECAASNGLTDKLDTLFRWKAEIIAKEWKSTPDRIKDAFAPAITSKFGKASVKVEDARAGNANESVR